jgi:hypothetical protein
LKSNERGNNRKIEIEILALIVQPFLWRFTIFLCSISILEGIILKILTDRQTDRQTEITPYQKFFNSKKACLEHAFFVFGESDRSSPLPILSPVERRGVSQIYGRSIAKP